MNSRKNRLGQLRQALDTRRISWFGTRGIDAAPLARTGLLANVSSLVAPLREMVGNISEDCLECRLKRREDVNKYDIDFDTRLESCSFRDDLLSRSRSAKSGDSWLLGAYRPARFLAAINFTRSDVIAAHIFSDCQRVFEHKPWVERELENLGLRTLGWRYVRDSEVDLLRDAIKEFGHIVVRSTFSDGGVGLRLVGSASRLRGEMPDHDDGFVAYSPYLEGALPLNLNACVYADGQVRVFHLSVQLIGIEACTNLKFGFCGNDFLSASELDRSILLLAEQLANRVGKWGARHGYQGQFGLDFLLHDGDLLITEMNPRFQASTFISEGLAETQGLTGPYLEHIASFLGLPPPSRAELPDLYSQNERCSELYGQCDLGQIICYNDRGVGIRVASVERELVPEEASILGVPTSDVIVAPGAMLGKVLSREKVTDDGYSLLNNYADVRGIFHTSQIL